MKMERTQKWHLCMAKWCDQFLPNITLWEYHSVRNGEGDESPLTNDLWGYIPLSTQPTDLVPLIGLVTQPDV